MSKRMMTAVFEVKFDPEDMCDKETVKKEFNGSYLKLMKWLYKNDGIGIFDKDLKLVGLLK